jgi:hypothetical protein
MSSRLLRLEQILAQTSRTAVDSVRRDDAADVHLGSVSEERLRRLTSELSREMSSELDPVDAITMRLLLDEYTSSVSHLRAVATMAAAGVDRTTGPLRDARRSLHQYMKELRASRADGLARRTKKHSSY